MLHVHLMWCATQIRLCYSYALPPYLRTWIFASLCWQKCYGHKIFRPFQIILSFSAGCFIAKTTFYGEKKKISKQHIYSYYRLYSLNVYKVNLTRIRLWLRPPCIHQYFSSKIVGVMCFPRTYICNISIQGKGTQVRLQISVLDKKAELFRALSYSKTEQFILGR